MRRREGEGFGMTTDFGLADDPVVKAANRIADTAAGVTRQARELADILATVGAGWQGLGASGFVSAQTVVNEDHEQIRRLLGVLHHAVSETRNLSNAQDDDVRAAFRSVRSATGAGGSALHGI
ncbi:WXG100 family type VII secretion target [Streptomyces sp. NPDC091268]|uniref:WXG100 family type VII secretion target n=1 Tax=Streptomyces sp. NPDC091268 TaxID=3365979 RepID=UPI00382D1EFD